MDNNETVGLELSSAGEKMLQEELAKLTANSQERLAGFMNSEEFSQHNGATLRIWDGFPWGDNRLAKDFLRRLLTLFPEEEFRFVRIHAYGSFILGKFLGPHRLGVRMIPTIRFDDPKQEIPW